MFAINIGRYQKDMNIGRWQGVYDDGCTPPTISAGADRIDTAQLTDTITLTIGGGTCDSVTGASLPAWMTLEKTGANMGRLIIAPTDSVDATEYVFTAHGCSDALDTVNITVTWGDVTLTSVAPDTVWWGDTATILGRGFKNAQGTSTFAWGDSTPTMALWKNDTLKPICPQMDTGFYTFIVSNGTMSDTLTTDSIYVAGQRIPTYTLTLAATNGSTVPATGDTTVDSGGVVTISCTPDAGYTFTGWEIVSGELDLGVDSTTVTVNGDGTLKANLIVSNFNINSDTSVTITVHSDTVFWGTPPLTDTIYAGIRWTINKMIDFSGTTDARNSLISNSTGDMDTITKPQDTIQNVFCRDQWFTNPQYLSEITGGGDNYNEKYLPSYDSVVIRDWFRQSGKITCNWLRVTATDSAYFNDTIIVRDSVIYDIGTKPFGATGSLMLSTPGYVCRVKTNGIRNLPRIIKKGPGGIKWD